MASLVSIVLPVYNAEDYLNEAILSLLSQTYDGFELIIVNDGSTDKSQEIISGYLTDQRVRAFERANHGLISTLNFAISKCRGNYIARMDADDIALPDRISLQAKMLDKGYDLVAGNAIYIDGGGNELGCSRRPLNMHEIVTYMAFNSPFIHPAIMMRKEIFERDSYSKADYLVEDYALWMRLIVGGNVKCINIPDNVIKYRLHQSGVSRVKRLEQLNASCEARRKYLLPAYIEKNYGGAKEFVCRGDGVELLNFFSAGLRFARSRKGGWIAFFRIVAMEFKRRMKW